jgi:mRNA interferase HigB
MRVIAYKTLRDFGESNPAYQDVVEPARAWFRHALTADWKHPAEVKADLRTASILKDGRVVFNLAGNKYRLVVWINYPFRVVYVRSSGTIGTHKQYDQIDAQTI